MKLFALTFAVLTLAMLTACDYAEMPPCSSIIVVGSVTFNCEGLKPK